MEYTAVDYMNKEAYKEKFRQKKCCIIIPTYNNQNTLSEVIRSVSEYSDDIIIVNDGSTDTTPSILQGFPQYHRISHDKNMGKGMALRTGFKCAISKGYDYAISIDSDGQHLAYDLPKFIDMLETEPSTLIVGARNMDVAHVPKKSNVGNSISTFWFTFETGIKLPDTQSGFRLYPVYLLKDIKFFTTKYEFEIEVIVRAAWRGIKVISIPISVYYAPQATRLSHFKPFKDSTRITILNIILVINTVLYIYPRNWLRKIRSTDLKTFFRTHFLNAEESNKTKALSVALGVFMGIAPVPGFQLITAGLLAFFFRLNKVIVLLSVNISVPPIFPFIIYFGYIIGGYFFDHPNQLDFNKTITLKDVLNNYLQYAIGSIVLATFAAIVFGLITYILLALFRKKSGKDALPININQ